MLSEIIETLRKLREQKPLIHQITNYVSANDCANITLAIGASPVMAQDAREAEEMTSRADALVVNIGTLQSECVESMFLAARKAKERSIPVIFDPVGVGATQYRTETAIRFIEEIRPDIIRCNVSEAKALCKMGGEIKGVDSVASEADAGRAARRLANSSGAVVAATGKIDWIAGGGWIARIANGHPMLARVTGTGCMASALSACFASLGGASCGAAGGVLSMGIAGEIAAASLKGTEGAGTYRARLLDAIDRLDEKTLRQYANIEVEGA